MVVWHGNPTLYEATDLNKIQKKSQRVDEYKNNWALSHGYPILRIWEKDINEKPSEVMKKLEDVFYLKTGEKKKIYRKDINTTPRKRVNNKLKKPIKK